MVNRSQRVHDAETRRPEPRCERSLALADTSSFRASSFPFVVGRNWLLALAMAIIGCGANSEKKYIPSTTAARDALDATLAAWKSGAPYGPIQSGKTPVNVFEGRWQAGKKLESFEVLREEPSEGPKKFVVSTKLIGEAKPTEIAYLVVGKDPLLVFREDDFLKASGVGK